MNDSLFTSKVRDLIFRFRPEFLGRGSVPESSIRPSGVNGQVLKTVSGLSDWSSSVTGAFAASMYAANSGAPTHTSDGGTQKVGSGGGTLTWVSEFDVRPGGYAAQVDTTTNKRIDIKYDGLYWVRGSVGWTSLADGTICAVYVYKNGAACSEHTGALGFASGYYLHTEKVVSLAAGNYLELYANQNDTASEAYAVSSSHITYLQAIYLGPSS